MSDTERYQRRTTKVKSLLELVEERNHSTIELVSLVSISKNRL